MHLIAPFSAVAAASSHRSSPHVVPICSRCRRVRVAGVTFEERPSEAATAIALDIASHTVCPECAAEVCGVSRSEYLKLCGQALAG